MRYIFTAAIATLLLIAALLALPPIGQTESVLVAETAGNRLAVSDVVTESSTSTTSTTTTSPPGRLALAPSSTEGVILADVLGSVELGEALEESDASTADDAATESSESSSEDDAALGADRSLSVDEPEQPVETTTTTTSTTTTTTTTTTTEPPATTEAAAETPAATANPGDGGVVISPRGVVLPIIGPASGGGWRASTPCGNEVTLTEGQQVVSVDFVLDPGHGGSEPGAVGPNGATEKELNLRIAEIVEWYLEEAGYSVLLTRTTDIRLPLLSRAEIANALNPDAFISIHHNGGATRVQSTPGTEMFVDGGNPEASRLGGLLFEEMIDHMSQYDAEWVGSWRNGVGTRYNSSGEDLYGIHRYTPGIPSVITEVGYLSNPSEAALYVQNDVQWSHAKAIADGLIRWSTTTEEGYGYLADFVDDSSSGTGGFSGCTDPSL